MNLTPDALLLGPLALSWPNLALLLGVLSFSRLAAGRGYEATGGWILLAVLLAARVGYALEHPSSWPSLSSALLGIVDIRSGGWNWWIGLAAGGLTAVALLRTRATQLLLPALASLLVAFVPLGFQQGLLRSSQNSTSEDLQARLLVYLESGQAQPSEMRFGDLAKPMLVNIWATWCPPCRAEMPLLAEYQQKGHPIMLLNAGENSASIQSFLQQNHLKADIFVDHSNLRQVFQVSGLPTTLLIGPEGQILKRHMGALNRAQLEGFLQEMQ